MGIGEFVKSQFLDVIELVDESQGKLLVSKFERKHVTDSGIGKDEIRQGSQLIVRNGQVGVFVCQGRIADVFEPGKYRLTTENLPLLSDLGAIPFLMNSPLKSDLYFVNTTQFLNNKWGTTNPIIVRDNEMGMVRITALGNYSFCVNDAKLFMNEVFGARKLNMTYDIIQFLNSFIAEAITEQIAKMQTSVLDLAANCRQLSAQMTEVANEKAKPLGLEISEATVESIGLPEEVEKLIDEQSGIGMASNNMQNFMQYQTARAMRDAAKQEGGLAGLGAGVALGNQMANAIGNMGADNTQVNSADTSTADPISELKKYKELLDADIISQEEFDALKKKLLNL